MEKTLTIDGQQVSFKSTAATPLRYKAQFGSDFLGDIIKMYPMMNKFEKKKKKDEEISYEELQNINFDIFYNIVWSLAKTSDKSIPEPIEWLDRFEEFPLFDIFPELQEMLVRNLQTKKK